MSNEQFDDIENLGRDAADKHSLPFKEEAWDKMLQLLDEDEKKRRPIIWWWWALPLVLLLSAGGGYWAVKNNGKQHDNEATPQQSISSNQKKLPNNSTTTTPLVAPSDAATAAAPLHAKNESNTKTSAKNAIDNGKASVVINNAEPILKNESTVKTSAQKPTVIYNKPNKNNNSTRKLVVTKNTTGEIAKADVYKTSGNTTSINTAKKADEIAGNTDETSSVVPLADKPMLPKTDSATSTAALKDTTTKNVAEAATMPAKKEKKPPLSFPHWDISASISGDVTTVKFKKANKVSMGYGLGISYRFTNRFSIGTGVAITRKLYVADSTNYDKDLYAAYHWRVSNIDANCNVVEVPINIQYRVTNGLKNNLFVTAGLSSYFMRTETYDFTYLRYGVPGKTSYTYKKQSNDRLAILNLSLDYSRKLSKQFALSISPFAKLPLTGVGKGNVSLTSAGLQVGVHYQPK